MNRHDSPDLDPEVLADPVEDEGRDSTDSAGSLPAEPDPAKAGALVKKTGRGDLAPFDPFRRYMAEIAKYPPLDREQEQALSRRYRDTGDREALFRLATANLMMVAKVALSFRRAARNLLDLIQEGNLGLLKAIEGFDPELGVRLPTYAGWWVRAYMVKFLLDNVRLVRVGTTNARRKLLRNLRKERERLEGMGYEVGPKLLASHFGVSEDDVRDVEMALSSRDFSLDQPQGGQESPSPAERLADTDLPSAEDTVARRELQTQAEEAIGEFRRDLNERELALLDQRILAEDPLTLQALGDRFGTTREAVRQGEARLMRRLEAFLRERLGDQGQIRLGRKP